MRDLVSWMQTRKDVSGSCGVRECDRESTTARAQVGSTVVRVRV